jgi:hypothetical protein
MSNPKPVFPNHKRVKSKLVTPFNASLGPLREVSWINTIVPELLWVALVQNQFGPRRGVEIITAFTRDLRASDAKRLRTIWAAAGKFETISADEMEKLLATKARLYADDLRYALSPLCAWYPDHPLNTIFHGHMQSCEAKGLQHLKLVVGDLFDRSSMVATMTQATAIWLAFDAERLKVSPHLTLAQFPKIEEYPNTELSVRLAASIRASVNSFFGDTDLMKSESSWPVAFWNRGLELEPCEDFNGDG